MKDTDIAIKKKKRKCFSSGTAFESKQFFQEPKICLQSRIASVFPFLKEINLIIFLQYKTTREIEFEEYLGLPAWHLEERTKSLNSSHCYKEIWMENTQKKI